MVITDAFGWTLEVSGNKDPRFFSLDQFEQPSIFVGCPIALASCSTSHLLSAHKKIR
jgi:hypothetical protein